MNFDFGSRIKSLRLSRSMTQEQLAQKLGVSAQAVSKWESGTNMPDMNSPTLCGQHKKAPM